MEIGRHLLTLSILFLFYKIKFDLKIGSTLVIIDTGAIFTFIASMKLVKQEKLKIDSSTKHVANNKTPFTNAL